MATTIPGETYLGETLVQPLSETGDVTIYVWPLRCLNTKMGGPTFGIDVGDEEIIRFDPHGPGGHWHALGYDKLLEQAGYQEQAKSLDGALVEKATQAISEHIQKEGDLRPRAIEMGALEE